METGYITHWNSERKFGFIAVKRVGGWLDKFFMLESHIVRKEVEPSIGGLIIFDGTIPSKISNGYPLATNIQVLRKPEQAQKVEPKAGA